MVSPDERLRRPKLERTQPIRSWSTLFEAPGPIGGQLIPAVDGGQGPALGAVVSRSVELAYRVVDDYIRRGQQTAQRIGERSYDVQAVTSDLQDIAVRTFQFASDFATLWLDLLQRAATDSAGFRPRPAPGGAAAPPPSPMASPPAASSSVAATPGETPRRSPVRMQVHVSTTQPTEVTLDLSPEVIGPRLVVPALRAVDPATPHLTDLGVRPEADGQPPTLWITVPAGQPAGVYSGVMVDEPTSRPVGTVRVRIAAAS
jgi:hypothetical protein